MGSQKQVRINSFSGLSLELVGGHQLLSGALPWGEKGKIHKRKLPESSRKIPGDGSTSPEEIPGSSHEKVVYAFPCLLFFRLYLLSFKREKGAQRLTFWVRRPPGGVGVFHVKGWWPKSSCPPSKVCLPWVSK